MSLSLALILTAGAAYADLAGIDRAVAAFTGAAIGQPGGASAPVDRRLALGPCAAPLALSWHTPRRESVVVQCPDNGGWRLFVPVIGAVREEAALPAIHRGDAVSIAVSGDGFAVSQPGEAIEAGAVGAWIRVRAAGAQRAAETMRARVIRPGLVEMQLP